jgi:F-type H+-transporting ATPase subunit a
MSPDQELTPSEYIVHHLTHLTRLGSDAKQQSIIDMSLINLDTIFFSVLMGIVGCLVLYIAARRATSGVPNRFQGAVEVLIEFVDNQAKSIVHGDRSFIAPLALTVFVWVFLMNSLDFLPVDLVSRTVYWLGLTDTIHYVRIVPTADINGTFGISLAVLLIVIYYNLKIKGFGGFTHELLTAPFGTVKVTLNPLSWLALIGLTFANAFLNLIEFVARTVSLAMRLFGNMYAGELLFLLIALLGSSMATWWGAGPIVRDLMQIAAGSAWVIFHILIVLLQAFIFMMLTLVYIGQAHTSH